MHGMNVSFCLFIYSNLKFHFLSLSRFLNRRPISSTYWM